MQSPHRSSPASQGLGTILALASIATFASLCLAGSDQGGASQAGLGNFLYGAFSWSSFFIPLWLAAAAVIAFLPGFRPAAIFSLAASVLPFFLLALFARISSDPFPWFQSWPLLENLGLTAVGLAFFLVILFLSLLIARLALFFPPGEEEESPRRRLPPKLIPSLVTTPSRRGTSAGAAASAPAKAEAPTSAQASAQASGDFEFKVPKLPPPPRLTCLGEKDEEAQELEPLEAGLDADPDELGEEPIPLFFGERRRQGAYAEDPPIMAEAVDPPAGTEAGPRPHGAQAPVPSAEPLSAPPVALPAARPSGLPAAPPSAGPSVLPSALASVPLSDPQPAEEAKQASSQVEIGAPGIGHPIEYISVPPAPGTTVSAEDEAEAAARAETARRLLERRKAKAYAVPVDGLLNAYPDGQYWVIDEKTKRSAEVLQETLAEFNIKAEVTGIRKGPVITMFEILPAPGVKLSKITNLSDNIALRLAASSVRIVAPIPGKHAVGIEVPNEKRSVVSLREVVENESFRTSKMEIPVALGKDIAGEIQFIDLVQTPHLLIAGATGSGKSVSVNSIILSILFRRSPEEVRLILIDPKIVELKLYNDVPHLLTPVITEPKRAFQALQYCICEMERRYTMLDRLGVRDIKSYNRKIKDKGFVQERLPYIVVIIDEFADLMATTGKELESTLARLAAMSRAVGIHLVLATQRPSIDVITGLIKANIPSRIAFMVASKFDSRIIIDMVGAEKLLGKGDMLFASAWDPFPIRMQGAFVSEEEVEKSVEFVKTLGEPDYIDEEIFIDEDEEDEGPTLFDDGDGDPLFEQALEIVLQQGKASASYIQRKLKIGYNRAARLVELMEERGIVGPAQGSKPRDIVRNPEVFGAGGGKMSTPPANRGAPEGRLPSLLADLETVPGQRVTGRDEPDED